MTWLILCLMAPLFWALTNFIDKYILERHITSISDFLFFSSLSSFIFLPFITVIFGVPEITSYTILVVFSGMIQVASYGFYARGLEKGETSSIMMLMGLGPIIVILAGYIFLGQVLDGLEILSALIVVAGVVIVMLNNIKALSLRLLFKPGADWMLITVIIWSGNMVFADWLLQQMTFADFFVLDVLGMAILGLFLLILPVTRKKVKEGLRVSARAKYGWFICNTALDIAAQLCVKLALFFVPLAGIVAVALQIQNFYLVAMGYAITVFVPHVIEEDISRPVVIRKLIGASLILIGIAVLSI